MRRVKQIHKTYIKHKTNEVRLNSKKLAHMNKSRFVETMPL